MTHFQEGNTTPQGMRPGQGSQNAMNPTPMSNVTSKPAYVSQNPVNLTTNTPNPPGQHYPIGNLTFSIRNSNGVRNGSPANRNPMSAPNLRQYSTVNHRNTMNHNNLMNHNYLMNPGYRPMGYTLPRPVQNPNSFPIHNRPVYSFKDNSQVQRNQLLPNQSQVNANPAAAKKDRVLKKKSLSNSKSAVQCETIDLTDSSVKQAFETFRSKKPTKVC